MKSAKKVKIIRIIFSILALIAIAGITIYLFPVITKLTTTEGQIEFKERISNSGIWGILILCALQIAQIFLFILPGEPIEIMAGMCYGGFWGTVFIMVSNFIVTTIIFLLVRKYGRKFLYTIADEKQITKLEQSKLFKNPKKIEYIMFVLFFVPGTPKDLLTYIAGLLPIDFKRFVIITTIARIPSVISSTFAGTNLSIGNWKTSIGLYLGILVIVGIIILIANSLDKDKTTEDIFKEINKK